MSEEALTAWLRTEFPDYGHVGIGISGWAMVDTVLRQSARDVVVLPAFICSQVSFMIHRMGKQLIHIDAAKGHLHMDRELLEDQLNRLDPGRTVLLVDHSFGYPLPWLAVIRDRFPSLLIIEDAVRALEGMHRGQVQPVGDHLLLSLYKTVPQNSNGAVLLSRQPVDIPAGAQARDGLRNKLSGNGLFRFLYEARKRRHPDYHQPDHDDSRVLDWHPHAGRPAGAGINRFLRYATAIDRRAGDWERVINELTDMLARQPGVDPLGEGDGHNPSLRFVSFTVASDVAKVELLTRLHRQGLFLLGTWDQVPGFFTCFRESFPFGTDRAVHLADHVIHIPVSAFESPGRRGRLRRCLPATLEACR